MTSHSRRRFWPGAFRQAQPGRHLQNRTPRRWQWNLGHHGKPHPHSGPRAHLQKHFRRGRRREDVLHPRARLRNARAGRLRRPESLEPAEDSKRQVRPDPATVPESAFAGTRMVARTCPPSVAIRARTRDDNAPPHPWRSPLPEGSDPTITSS